jgi:hypothetical protein
MVCCQSNSRAKKAAIKVSEKSPPPFRQDTAGAMKACPDCKPVSVPLRAMVIPLGRPLLDGSSNLPESRTERAAPPLLFGLAPHGVCPAGRIASPAVRSCRTFSPLPPIEASPARRRYIFCGTFRKTRFERVPPAVSRHAALWRPDFPPERRRTARPSDHPSEQANLIVAEIDGIVAEID